MVILTNARPRALEQIPEAVHPVVVNCKLEKAESISIRARGAPQRTSIAHRRIL